MQYKVLVDHTIAQYPVVLKNDRANAPSKASMYKALFNLEENAFMNSSPSQMRAHSEVSDDKVPTPDRSFPAAQMSGSMVIKRLVEWLIAHGVLAEIDVTPVL
jgi:hypothetical protein